MCGRKIYKKTRIIIIPFVNISIVFQASLYITKAINEIKKTQKYLKLPLLKNMI